MYMYVLLLLFVFKLSADSLNPSAVISIKAAAASASFVFASRYLSSPPVCIPHTLSNIIQFHVAEIYIISIHCGSKPKVTELEVEPSPS